MRSLNFILKNKKFLLFGLLLTFFSTFGQTSFLSIFTTHLRQKFQLTSGEMGLIYSAATLLSAIAISYTGRWIDRMELKKFTLFVTLLFACACLSMATSSSLLVLFISYFLLRYTCQGLMCHTSMVSMARYFHKERGKALSIAALGYPLGDACLPIGIAVIFQSYGIGVTWWILFGFAAIIIIPLLSYLLGDHNARHQNYLEHFEKQKETASGFTPREVLQDWKFYFVTLGILAPGFVNTGIFFQNAELIQTKGWPEYVYAASLVNYALGNILGSFISGVLIDKFKSMRIITFYLFPMLIGLIVLLQMTPVWAISVFMLGIGLSQGASSVIVGVVWAELYGSKYLGTIRSWVYALKVLFTAISPVLFGFLIDRHISFSAILFSCAIYTLFSIGSLMTVILKLKDTAPKEA
jgi:MFS family permease